MAAPPSKAEIAGSPSNAAANSGFNKFYDFMIGLLGNTGNAPDARTALGISATNTPSTATNGIIATTVQTALAEIGARINTLTTDMSSDTTAIASTAFVKAATGGTHSATVTTVDVTLTAAEAVNGIIIVGGALTGNRTLYVPSGLKRKWQIINNTSGAYTLTVKPTGGTGVVVAQNKSTLLSSTGTAVVKVFTDILSELILVDGAGSGLDADYLDGYHASAFAQSDGSNASGAWSGITVAFSQVSSKPTTLSGYGITDAIGSGTAISNLADGAVSAAAKIAANVVTTTKLGREGTVGQMLYSGGPSSDPYWAAPPVSGVTSANIQGQTFTAFTTAGTLTAYTLTPTPAIAANASGLRFRVKFHTAAGASPTLAVSGKTAASLKYVNSAGTKVAVTSAQIPINWVSDVEYDGTDWVVLNRADTDAVSKDMGAQTVGALAVGSNFKIGGAGWIVGTTYTAAQSLTGASSGSWRCLSSQNTGGFTDNSSNIWYVGIGLFQRIS